jgi:DDE superfamily endonuclease
MATPFKGVSGETKDSYNFYHSQIRINIECAFGILCHRFSILRKPIATRISIARTTALVMALCKLHNFCIDHSNVHVDVMMMINAVDEKKMTKMREKADDDYK